MPKRWKPSNRNWGGIQFEEIRRKIDPKYNECHDVLSSSYYERKPFIWKGKNWGVLDKETFDKLHGLIFHLRMLELSEVTEKEKTLPKQLCSSEDAKIAREAVKALSRQKIELEV